MIRTKFLAAVVAAAALGTAGGVAWAVADTNVNQPHIGTASYLTPGPGFVDLRYWACDNPAGSRVLDVSGFLTVGITPYTMLPLLTTVPCSTPQIPLVITTVAECPGGVFIAVTIEYQYRAFPNGVTADPLIDVSALGTVQNGTFNHWN